MRCMSSLLNLSPWLSWCHTEMFAKQHILKVTPACLHACTLLCFVIWITACTDILSHVETSWGPFSPEVKPPSSQGQAASSIHLNTTDTHNSLESPIPTTVN